jgi:hypothetical protein
VPPATFPDTERLRVPKYPFTYEFPVVREPLDEPSEVTVFDVNSEII